MKLAKPELPMIQPSSKPAQETRNPKLLEASRMYEKQFLREMVQAMRKTVQHGGLVEESMGEGIFRQQLDDHYVEAWGDKGGIGLADMIYTQVAERYGIGQAMKPLRMQGMHPLSNSKVMSLEQKKESSDLQMKVQVEEKGSRIQSPWGGRVLATGPLSDGRSFARVDHESGLRSEFTFKGSLGDIAPGQIVQPQQTIGLLSDEQREFEWSLKPAPEGVFR